MVATIPKKTALILALCLFPSCLVWTPYAFECGGGYYSSIGGRHHRHHRELAVPPPLPLSLQLLQQQQQQRPNAKLELFRNNVIQQDCQQQHRQQQQQLFQTSNDDSTIIIRDSNTAGADNNNDITMHNSLERESNDLPSISRNSNKKRIRWTAVAAILLLLVGKVGPNNNWITTKAAAAVASSTATTTTTTSTTTTGGPIMFSAVSASILRRRQKGITTIPVNFLQVVSLTFMVWQLLTQAGTLIGTVGLYCGLFMKWYTSILSSAPLLTKTITGATIGVVGDMIAQYVERRIETKQSSKSHNNDYQHQQQQYPKDTTDLLTMYEQQQEFSTADLSDSFNEGITISNRNGYLNKMWQEIRRYDGRRGASVVGENLLISGPLLHVAYDTLEHLIPTTGGGIGASVAAAGHVLADNFLLDPIFVAITFIMTGLAEGYSIRELKSQFRRDYPATIKTTWAASVLLAPVGFVCFRFLPLNYRVLGVNFIDIAWDAMISFSIHRSRRGHHNQQKMDEYEVQKHAGVPAHLERI